MTVCKKLIWKVNIKVIPTLERDWPQEATLSVVINSYIGNWNWMLTKLYYCQNHTAALFLNFAKWSCISRFLLRCQQVPHSLQTKRNMALQKNDRGWIHNQPSSQKGVWADTACYLHLLVGYRHLPDCEWRFFFTALSDCSSPTQAAHIKTWLSMGWYVS